jgi:hypothetical protein
VEGPGSLDIEKKATADRNGIESTKHKDEGKEMLQTSNQKRAQRDGGQIIEEPG